jgi:hypothetical protein
MLRLHSEADQIYQPEKQRSGLDTRTETDSSTLDKLFPQTNT